MLYVIIGVSAAGGLAVFIVILTCVVTPERAQGVATVFSSVGKLLRRGAGSSGDTVIVTNPSSSAQANAAAPKLPGENMLRNIRL